MSYGWDSGDEGVNQHQEIAHVLLLRENKMFISSVSMEKKILMTACILVYLCGFFFVWLFVCGFLFACVDFCLCGFLFVIISVCLLVWISVCVNFCLCSFLFASFVFVWISVVYLSGFLFVCVDFLFVCLLLLLLLV